ncbi:MAG: hypothetical protein DHS20C17_18970 [Cyclobacteriaceae bacterium]|nr:MAG: hypothetical protein DHS20C17_18970 [Cyclobacteriaceae bacterium]
MEKISTKASSIRKKFETLILVLGVIMAIVVGLSYSTGGMDYPVYTSQLKPVSNQVEVKDNSLEDINKPPCSIHTAL